MSVINKVLRDLDRQSGGDAGPGAPNLRRGTSSVEVQDRPSRPVIRPSTRIWLFAAMLGVPVLLTAGFWASSIRLQSPVNEALVKTMVPAPQVAAQVTPPTTPASSMAAASTPAPGPAVTVPVGAAQPSLPPVRATRAAVATAAGTAPVTATRSTPLTPLPTVTAGGSASIGSVPSTPTAQPPAAPVPASRSAGTIAASGSTAATRPASALPQWQESAQDTLVQAQRLWTDGARDQALDVLRDALLAVERMLVTDPGPSGNALALALLRERIRMDMAQGQPASVLSWIRRFERLTQREADLWALRGHAAQRLGQHADAAPAYVQALRLQPGEPRWMLAAAVSLAATGQVAAAAEWAEQARAQGTVSADVLAYLRQVGVPLR